MSDCKSFNPVELGKKFVKHTELFCKIFFNHWQGNRDEVDKLIKEAAILYERIDVAPNLTLNLLAANIIMYATASIGGYTKETQMFLFWWITIPSFAGALEYYYHRYGMAAFTISSQTVLSYINNLALVYSSWMIGWAQYAVVFVFLLYLEPFLPSFLQGEIFVESLEHENSAKATCQFLYSLGLVALFFTPAWVKGYNLSMAAIGREKVTMSNKQCVREIIYTLVTNSINIVHNAALVKFQCEYLGYRFHVIHVVCGMLEFIFLNQTLNIRFIILHFISHEIKPLYNMVHLEHHLCKGTYPHTAGLAALEVVYGAGSTVIGSHMMGATPYTVLNFFYAGPNIVPHTMLPWKSALQYHSLHHTSLADVYSANIPGSYDKAHSKFYAKFHEQWEKPGYYFIIYPWLSDVVGILTMLFFGVILHQFDIGFVYLVNSGKIVVK